MDDLLANGHFKNLTDTLLDHPSQPAAEPDPAPQTEAQSEAELRFRDKVYAEVSLTAMLCR